MIIPSYLFWRTSKKQPRMDHTHYIRKDCLVFGYDVMPTGFFSLSSITKWIWIPNPFWSARSKNCPSSVTRSIFLLLLNYTLAVWNKHLLYLNFGCSVSASVARSRDFPPANALSKRRTISVASPSPPFPVLAAIPSGSILLRLCLRN